VLVSGWSVGVSAYMFLRGGGGGGGGGELLSPSPDII